MGVFHYGAPWVAVPTKLARPEPVHLIHEWIGWDESLWNMCGLDRVTSVALRSGVRGLTAPAHQEFVRESPAWSGQQYLGHRTMPRSVFWPISVLAPKAEWYGHDAAWWRTMHPARAGVWRVTNPITDSARELSLRFVDDNDHAMVTDPGLQGWEQYGVHLVADDPFWRGSWVTRTFSAPDEPPPLYGPDGPALFIASGSQMDRATIDNPGDEPSYLVYILDGPFTSAEVGIGDPGATTEYLATVAEGESVVIDTRPSSPSTARLIPTPTAEPGSAEWEAQVFLPQGESAFAGVGRLALNSPLQPGQARAVLLSMVGAGSVTVAHQPGYSRAY